MNGESDLSPRLGDGGSVAGSLDFPIRAKPIFELEFGEGGGEHRHVVTLWYRAAVEEIARRPCLGLHAASTFLSLG